MDVYIIKIKSIASISFLFAMTICFSGCKKVKNDEVDASIYVKQYSTGTPIADAMVVITRGKPGSGVGTAAVETLYTDAEGKVKYAGGIDNDYMYYAEAYKYKYFDTHNQQVGVTTGEKNFNTTIYMYAYSYVKLHVKNVNPFNQYDLFELSGFCTNNFYIQGIAIDTTFFFCDYGLEFMGDFEYSYSYSVTKNSNVTQTPFYLTPVPHDTITLNINY